MSRRTREVGFATERIVVSLRRYERTRALVDGDPSLAREIVREVEDELGAEALKVLDDYTAQRKAGKDPVFVADTIEGLPPTECWHVEELKEYGKPPVKEYLDDQIEVEYAGLN